MFLEGKFVGGVDVVCELIQEGEFIDMVPKACLPLPAAEQLSLDMAQPLVCFLTEDQQMTEQLALTYSKVRVTPELAKLLSDRYAVTEFPCFFYNQQLTTLDVLRQTLKPKSKEDLLNERLLMLTTQATVVLFMKGKP